MRLIEKQNSLMDSQTNADVGVIKMQYFFRVVWQFDGRKLIISKQINFQIVRSQFIECSQWHQLECPQATMNLIPMYAPTKSTVLNAISFEIP